MNAIQIEGLTFAYPRTAPCLRDLSWSVPEGAFALIVGQNGTGKSTLLRNLKPELAPAGDVAGSIRVFDRELDTYTPRESASLIGYVSQNPVNQIVCDKVWHELAFGLENLGMAQDEMRVRVAEVSNFFGLDAIIRADTASLSGGKQQTLALASAIALKPRLLLLDEPTSQLDPVASKNFLHALFRVNRELGVTVVVCTHEPEGLADYATSCFELTPAGMVERDLEVLRRRAHGTDVSWTGGADAARLAPGAPASSALAAEARDVYFRYGREQAWVMRGCDLSVRQGSVHALVGGNGSGKSTLLSLIAGVLKPQRGRIRNAAAHAQALLPQDPRALFVCDTVLEELREWQGRCGYDDQVVLSAARLAGLGDALDRNPYDLSGGQQQKLALQKLLLTGPRMLYLDEPTKGLDSASRVEVGRLLRDVAAGGTTIIMSTHDLSFASRVCDDVSLLFDGQLACTAPAAAFFRDNLFYRPPLDAFAEAWGAAAVGGAR